jgi:hypothetical protein
MVVEVGDVQVACGVHRRATGIRLVGEGQRCRGVCPRRDLPHPGVALTDDEDVPGGVDRHAVGVAEDGERKVGGVARPSLELPHLVVTEIGDEEGAVRVDGECGPLTAQTVERQRSRGGGARRQLQHRVGVLL